MNLHHEAQCAPQNPNVDYSRQDSLRDHLSALEAPRTHIIVGCGGIGAWLAVTLAMYGQRRITLMDGDKLEPSNMNRLPFPTTWVGRNKARATRDIIGMLRPDAVVSALAAHATENTLPALEHWISSGGCVLWDCTDDARIQRTLNALATERSTRYIKLGYEGMSLGIYSEMPVWFADEATYRPGYRTTSANVMSSMVAAALGAVYYGMGMSQDVSVKLDTLVKPKEQS